jgi:hypothetical protein
MWRVSRKVISVADCELLATCIFFNDHMTDMPTMSGIIKQRYCRGSNTQCARHLVYRRLDRESVPTDLYPSQLERAEQIVGDRE